MRYMKYIHIISWPIIWVIQFCYDGRVKVGLGVSDVEGNEIYPTYFGIDFVIFCFVSPRSLSLHEYTNAVN
jgi:hypothetical protein